MPSKLAAENITIKAIETKVINVFSLNELVWLAEGFAILVASGF